jgi:hypothetical protein
MSSSNRRSPEESRWLKVLSTLNEFQARLFVADKALDQGRGGISHLSKLTGMSRTTITKAVAELRSRTKLAGVRHDNGSFRLFRPLLYGQVSRRQWGFPKTAV